jgi:DNA (cytosine-5)-methyltransferase 1
MSTYHTIKQAADLLHISEQRVRTLCREGVLEAQKIGTNWLIDAPSLQHYGLSSAHQVAEDHPRYAPTTMPERRASTAQPSQPIALSFFSGAMGLDLGIEQAGFDIRLACELDKYCRQTIALNRPNVALVGDINDYSPAQVMRYAGLELGQELELMVGGPPCQAFSTAGKRKGFNDERGNAFLTYLDMAFAIRPRYLVIENVRGLLSCPMQHRPHDLRGPEFPDLTLDELPGGALNFVLSEIRRHGYGYSFNLYNAANFGTPQVRERVVLLCSRDGTRPPFLAPSHSERGEDGFKKWKTFRQATKGLVQHQHLNFPEKRLQYYRLLREGQNWKNLPEALQKEAMGNSYYAGGGKTGFLRRLAWDKPSPTLVTHPAMPATDLAHPSDNRPLSIQEYKRLQEFPDDWALAGPLIEQYKQVGNAVPASLGRAIGQTVMALLKAQPVAVPAAGFAYSRYKNTSDREWEAQFRRAAGLASQREPEAVQAALGRI